MRKRLAAATLAASITVGGFAGAVLGAPGLAGAAETASGAAGWVEEALGGLVTDGTITQAQADAVGTALEAARPAHGPGLRGGAKLEAVAEALGITADELRTELEAGKTIATVAGEKDVEVQAVVDAIVAAHKAHLDEEVAAGDLTQEEADARLEGAEARATAMVNGETPLGGRGRHGRAA
jgi:hypothetical protein